MSCPCLQKHKAIHVEGQSVLSLVLVKGQRTVNHSKTENTGIRLGRSSQHLRCTTACTMLPPSTTTKLLHVLCFPPLPPSNYSTPIVFTTQDSSDGEEVDSAADDASLVEDRHDDDILDLPTHRAPSHSHWALPLSHSHMSSSTPLQS